MEKSKLNYVLDLLMFLSFLISAITGLILFFFLPSRIRRAGYSELFGITKREFSLFHEYSGIIFIAFALIHIILHWRWVVFITKSLLKNKN